MLPVFLSQVPEVPAQGEDESDDEEETFATADTYTNYQPTKCKCLWFTHVLYNYYSYAIWPCQLINFTVKIGLTHPDPVVESRYYSVVNLYTIVLNVSH